MSKTSTVVLDTNLTHHVNAAKYCNKAAIEHSLAAQCYATGNTDRAREHTKNAHELCKDAQSLGMQALAA